MKRLMLFAAMLGTLLLATTLPVSAAGPVASYSFTPGTVRFTSPPPLGAVVDIELSALDASGTPVPNVNVYMYYLDLSNIGVGTVTNQGCNPSTFVPTVAKNNYHWTTCVTNSSGEVTGPPGADTDLQYTITTDLQGRCPSIGQGTGQQQIVAHSVQGFTGPSGYVTIDWTHCVNGG